MNGKTKHAWLLTTLLLFPAPLFAQTWVACANTRDAALVLAKGTMAQDIGEHTVSGEEHLHNDQYSSKIKENAVLVTDKPVTILDEYQSKGKSCVEIAP